jgi:ribonuclease BN (tRNA processing enzyme)
MYATEATQYIIQSHIFNWSVWPDFSKIPTPENPYLRFRTIRLDEDIVIADRTITALPASHTVPAVGYRLDSGNASLVFSGDTTTNDAFWHAVNKIPNLRYLIIETAFPDSQRELASLSKHLCPSLLADELRKLQHTPEVFITHLKPGRDQVTMQEIQETVRFCKPRMLQNDQVFDF